MYLLSTIVSTIQGLKHASGVVLLCCASFVTTRGLDPGRGTDGGECASQRRGEYSRTYWFRLAFALALPARPRAAA